MNFELTGPHIIERMHREGPNQVPQVLDLARQYIREARAAVPTGFTDGDVSGHNERVGQITGIKATNEAGNVVSGVKIKVTLNGPAVFKETGTNV